MTEPSAPAQAGGRRVLVVDRDPAVCSALRLLLTRGLGMEVVGEAGDLESALVQMRGARPDVVLLDWELPGLLAAGALQALRQPCPGAVLVVLSARPEHRPAALGAGAHAFVSKVDAPRHLLAALRAVCPSPRLGDSRCG